MVAYDFYKELYLGSRIPESAFPEFVQRAGAYLAFLERHCLVGGGEEARAMALCAMAEVFYEDSRHSGVQSTTVGGVSVRYEPSQASLRRKVFEAAQLYLDIYRGVKP